MAVSTITLQRTCAWARQFTFQRPSAIGNFLEPAITSANIVMQTMLGAPFYWRWNRVVTGFITAVGQQDYVVFNWAASTTITTIYVTVDDAGNSQACTTAGTTGTTAPSWNHTKGGTTTDGGVTWTNLGSINTPVSQTYDFAWIERASVQKMNPNSSTGSWQAMKPKITLELDSASSRPQNVAAEMSDDNGNITFRLMPVPDASYPIAITIQQKPSLFSPDNEGINETWGPIPDEYSHIYNWGFLSLMLLFADDPRFPVANQKFVSALLSTHQGLSQTEINIFLNNWQALTGQQISLDVRTQQGLQARGSI